MKFEGGDRTPNIIKEHSSNRSAGLSRVYFKS